jgi:hypothetical protein
MGYGNYDGAALINKFNLSVMNSILPSMPLITEEYPQVENIDQEEISICQIDTIFNDYYSPENRVLLKIDTQGFEKSFGKGKDCFGEHYSDSTGVIIC